MGGGGWHQGIEALEEAHGVLDGAGGLLGCRAALARHEVAGQKALVSAHTNGVSQREADSSSSSGGGGGGGGSSNSESGYGVWR